jgi:hypothetical protein
VFAGVWFGHVGGRRKKRLMTDNRARYALQLSRALHMPVGRMLNEMSSAELVYQMGYDSLLAQEREKAERLAKKGMSQKRPGER